MLARVRSGLTYANVMATVAVFLALGGGAYAAFKLPAHSVGSRELKSKAVTPSKVAPATIARFKGEKGDRGPQGVKGDTGAQGQQGIQGIPGNQGQTGPSNAYFGSSTIGQASVTIAAGNYLLFGACDFGAGASTIVGQDIMTSGATGDIASASTTIPANGYAAASRNVALHLSTGTTVYNDCTYGANGSAPSDTLTAIKVGSLTP